jgi:hypothetical protein
VIRLDVSVFPATTAAGGRALTSEPSGARTVTGSNAPPEAGMSGSVSTRTTKKHAERVTASGQLRFPRCCGAVPAKSISTASPAIVTAARIARSPSTASITSSAS